MEKSEKTSIGGVFNFESLSHLKPVLDELEMKDRLSILKKLNPEMSVILKTKMQINDLMEIQKSAFNVFEKKLKSEVEILKSRKVIAYIAKCDIPGGIKKGTEYKVDEISYLTPQNEPNFFIPVYEVIEETEETQKKYVLADVIQNYKQFKEEGIILSKTEKDEILESIFSFDITKLKNKNKVENVKLFILDFDLETVKRTMKKMIDKFYDFEEDEVLDVKNKVIFDFMRDKRFNFSLHITLNDLLNEIRD